MNIVEICVRLNVTENTSSQAQLYGVIQSIRFVRHNP